MGINPKVLSDFVAVDENLLTLLNNLMNKNIEFDKNLIIKYIKMFITRENRLSSQIPDDIELINDLLENLKFIVSENVSDSENSKFIISRIFNILNNHLINIKPSSQYANVFDGNEFFVMDRYLEFEYNQKCNLYNDNLSVRYLNYLENLRGFETYDEEIITNIEYYNLFINKNLLDQFIDSDFSIGNLDCFSDDKLMVDFGYENGEFNELKKNVIFSTVFQLLSFLLYSSEDSIIYIDALLNFKFYIRELSLSGINDLKDACYHFFKSYVGDEVSNCDNVISFVRDSIDEEIEYKQRNVSDLEIPLADYDKLKLFINLELKLLELVRSIDLISIDYKFVSKLDSFLRLEDDFVKGFSSYSVDQLYYFFVTGLSKIIGEDAEGEIFNLLCNRLFHRFSALNILDKCPSQDEKTYNIINRNYAVASANNCLELMKKNSDNDAIKSEFLKLYRDQFFVNPDLTELYVFFNGNLEMIEPFDYDFSLELSGVDEIEYDYDVSSQLFIEMCNLIDDFFTFNKNMENKDIALFQFKLLQFDYISNALDLDSINDAINYLRDNYDSDNNIYNILYSILEFNFNKCDYRLDVNTSDSKVMVNFLSK